MEIWFAKTTSDVQKSRDHGGQVTFLWFEWHLRHINLLLLANGLDVLACVLADDQVVRECSLFLKNKMINYTCYQLE